MAALLLLKLIFMFLSSMASLAFFLLCQCIAILTVVVKVFKFPSLVIEAALQQAEGLIRAAVELVGCAIWSIISNTFDLCVSLASGSVTSSAAALAELVERMRTLTGELAEILPELFEGVREIVGKVVENIGSNYQDAAGQWWNQGA